MPSIKKNFLYSSFLTTANYIFPLLTFPYVTRVLGVENLGICNFVDSVVNYFILFSAMGINTVGLREIATCKGDKGKLSQTFSSLLMLNALFTIAGIVLLLVLTFTVKELYEYKELMFFGAFKLLFNLLLVEWFYRGLEDFKYITMRTLVVKCLYVASVFVFVRKADDYPIYYLLTVLMVGVNAVINIFHSRKYTGFGIRELKMGRYVKPMFTLGFYMLLTSMYTTFNVSYLGFVSGPEQVGYYTTATKLYSVIIALFTAFTGVMLPRMSSLISENRIDEFSSLLRKSVDILLALSIPAIIYTIIYAQEIVLLIAGSGYEGAVLPMQIVMPLILIIGYEQILVIQALMPLKKDSIILRNSIIGAVAGVLLNIILVGKLQSVGSSIVWLSCELLILILSQIALNRVTKIRFNLKYLIKNIALYLPLIFIIFIKNISWFDYIEVLIVSLVVVLLYFIFIQLVVFREGAVCDIVLKTLRRIHK